MQNLNMLEKKKLYIPQVLRQVTLTLTQNPPNFKQNIE